jgi:hypothetical protein
MGAKTVDVVRSLPQETSPWTNDIVVFKDKAPDKPPVGSDAKSVSWEWVKGCLLSSRILPVDE